MSQNQRCYSSCYQNKRILGYSRCERFTVADANRDVLNIYISIDQCRDRPSLNKPVFESTVHLTKQQLEKPIIFFNRICPLKAKSPASNSS